MVGRLTFSRSARREAPKCRMAWKPKRLTPARRQGCFISWQKKDGKSFRQGAVHIYGKLLYDQDSLGEFVWGWKPMLPSRKRSPTCWPSWTVIWLTPAEDKD
jgi:hypothetical protein